MQHFAVFRYYRNLLWRTTCPARYFLHILPRVCRPVWYGTKILFFCSAHLITSCLPCAATTTSNDIVAIQTGGFQSSRCAFAFWGRLFFLGALFGFWRGSTSISWGLCTLFVKHFVLGDAFSFLTQKILQVVLTVCLCAFPLAYDFASTIFYQVCLSKPPRCFASNSLPDF